MMGDGDEKAQVYLAGAVLILFVPRSSVVFRTIMDFCLSDSGFSTAKNNAVDATHVAMNPAGNNTKKRGRLR